MKNYRKDLKIILICWFLMFMTLNTVSADFQCDIDALENLNNTEILNNTNTFYGYIKSQIPPKAETIIYVTVFLFFVLAIASNAPSEFLLEPPD